jgi:DNA-binding transcriptional MerR regulator
MAGNQNVHQIGKVGQKCGVSIHTIRYYEKLGLLDRPSRSEGGFRLYSQDAIDRLRFIKQAQSFGFTLSEIRQIMQASHQGLDCCCNYVSKILGRKLSNLETQIKELTTMKKGLKNMVKTWIPVKEARKKKYLICPQIEMVSRKTGGKKNGKKKH